MLNKKTYYIFGTAAIILLAFFIFMRTGTIRYNWVETYEEENKDPYGTYIVHQLLKNYFPDYSFKEITNSVTIDLPAKKEETSNYVFIGEGLYLDTSDVNQLLEFVGSGNNAFLATKSIPHDLMFYVYLRQCGEAYWEDFFVYEDSIVNLNLLHEDLKDSLGFDYQYVYQHEAMPYRWNYIDSVHFCEEEYSFIELGTMNDQQINFAKIPYDKGAFYFHTTPIAFSNIQLLDKIGIDYATGVFSHLPEGPIYWDAHSRVEEEVARRYNEMNSQSPNHGLSSESPLKYILSQAALAWAWYTSLALGLLYLIFRAKRKQRIIPVLESNSNTSLDFISSIGSLYFLQNDHKRLCLQKMKLFLGYVRERYKIPTANLDEQFVEKLSAYSEVPNEVIDKILLFNTNIKSSTFVSEKTLIAFHVEMDKFYKNCK